MTDPNVPSENRSDTDQRFPRRQFIAASGAGLALFAGCIDTSNVGDGSLFEHGDGEIQSTGTFRLLISDQPVAIDEFEYLDVTFDYARVFARDEAPDEDDDEEPDDDEVPDDDELPDDDEPDDDEVPDNDDDEEPPNNDTEEDAVELLSNDTNDDPEPPENDDQRGFEILDLDGATVDLTQVVGDKAIPIVEEELEAGWYSKIELHVEDVEGEVDEELVEVHVPSEKLQIVRPFEVVPEEELSFVFDINVVRRGQTGSYNLTPVIAKSGIQGEDVEVEEIDPDEEEPDSDDGENGNGENGNGNGSNQQGPPEDTPA